MITDPKRPTCLPDCDERHADGCPAEAAELAYWESYFGLRRGNDEATRAFNRRQLEAMDFRPETLRGGER